MLKYLRKNKEGSIRTSESLSKGFSSRRSTLKDSDLIEMSKLTIDNGSKDEKQRVETEECSILSDDLKLDNIRVNPNILRVPPKAE